MVRRHCYQHSCASAVLYRRYKFVSLDSWCVSNIVVSLFQLFLFVCIIKLILLCTSCTSANHVASGTVFMLKNYILKCNGCTQQCISNCCGFISVYRFCNYIHSSFFVGTRQMSVNCRFMF